MLLRSMTLALGLLVGVATAPHAAPELYRLDTARSQVDFELDMDGTAQSGTMPIKTARMMIDLENVQRSTVHVTLDAQAAQTGVAFVTGMMKGPEVLDTANFPEIHFQSTRIIGDLQGASVTGNLTIRGVTHPVTLKAGVFRQRGTDASNRDKLTVLLSGTISRDAFGAGGYPGFVGDRIGLRIVAQIEK
nr:YceI family protein [Pseudohalocynthiibacter aestuariivivens]